MPNVGKNLSVLRKKKKKKKDRFQGTYKQEVAQNRRKETRAIEVTLVGEDDVCYQRAK